MSERASNRRPFQRPHFFVETHRGLSDATRLGPSGIENAVTFDGVAPQPRALMRVSKK